MFVTQSYSNSFVLLKKQNNTESSLGITVTNLKILLKIIKITKIFN